MKYNPRPFERLLDKFIARQAARITGLMDSIYSQIAFHAFRFVGGKDDDFRFSKYPVLSKIVDGLLGKMFSSITSEVVSGIEWSWDLANSKNDDLIATLAKQLGLGVTDALFERWNAKNMAALEAYVKRREKGINLSQKVWNFGGRNKTELELALGLGLGEGKSAAELSRDVRQYLRFPDKLFRRVRDKDTGILKLSRNAAAFHPGQGVYRSSYKNALRLAATENNIAYRRSDYNRVSRMDFVLGIEVHLSANHTIIGPKGKPIEFFDICDELQGIYPKDFVFEGWHPQCYDEESEVYTDKGWKKFADVQDSDLILTLIPDTLDLEYSGYKMKFKSWYDGDMVHFFNRSYDQLVTPEHEVLCLDKNSKEPIFTRVKAEKCGKSRPIYRSSRWVGEYINSIQIGDQNVDFARFCEFMGYWLADGSLGHKWEVQIAQQDEHKKAIYDCIEAMGMNPRYNFGKVEFNSRDWYQYLSQFGKCADKFVPAQIKSSTPEQIQVFLDAFISCDGHIKRPRAFVGNHGNVCQPKEGERNYFTTSKRLADDLGELILKIGRRPAYRLQRSKGKVQHFSNGDYTINYDAWVISECRSVTATQYDKETLPYEGWVYDLVLEKNATMYIRRNGKCFWGSNCRCYTTTILPSREEFFKYLDGMDENGNSTYQFKDAVPEGKVPPQLQEWINNNKYRIERANTLPYFIEHNKGYIDAAMSAASLKDTSPQAVFEEIKKGWDIVGAGSYEEFAKTDASKFDFVGFKESVENIFGTKATGRISIYDDNEWRLTIKGNGFNLMRYFYFDAADAVTACEHEYFELSPNLQGKGLSKKLFNELYTQYKNVGVQKLVVHANIDVGGYTWARYGFSSTNRKQAESAIGYFASKYPELHDSALKVIDNYYAQNKLSNSRPFPMNLLTPDYKKLLLGSDWEGVLDFRNKEQLAIWESYLKS